MKIEGLKQKENSGERCIRRGEEEYPQALRQIRNPPATLYVRGALPDPALPCVAIIGARECSLYGRKMAEHFSQKLACAGVQIISGMAAGVDGIAQKAALEAGGRSFAVLGCGTDVCYPASNRELYDALLRGGGLLSEHSAGTPPLARHFPSRNRLISAFSDLILVIEARERSGTLITVDFGLEQGKEIYALPGRISDACSRGCNELIRQGAGIALTPKDILESLQNLGSLQNSGSTRSGSAGGLGYSFLEDRAECGEELTEEVRLSAREADERERIVWEGLGERPVTLQELYEALRALGKGGELGLPELLESLMSLTLRGLVVQRAGNRYERKPGIELVPSIHKER